MTGVRLGRRAFLSFLGFSTGGMLLAGGAKATEMIYGPKPLRTRLTWFARAMAKRTVSPPATVALGRCPSYDSDVYDCLRETWQLAGMPEVGGKRVLIKPNLIDVVEDRPTTTSPIVVGALVDLLQELGASEVVVGDGSGFRREGLSLARNMGLMEQLQRRGAAFVDLNYDDPRPVPVPDGLFGAASHIWLPKSVREADLIVSLPKLKTHHWAGASLSLKNLFGLMPGCRYGWPKNILHVNGITRSILGIYQAVRPLVPVVAVVDGITGMEGDGPLFGTAVPHGLLAVGQDPAAVDAICAELTGFSIEEVVPLGVATWIGAGQIARIQTTGSNPENLTRKYRRPPGMEPDAGL